MTREEEVRLSFTSQGEFAIGLDPPTLSLYNFAIDRATLKDKHVAVLRVIAALIKLFPDSKARIVVNGHADSSGEDTINDPLSKNRALTIQSALGAPSDIFWYGERKPIATNETVDGRSRNRRVDITFAVDIPKKKDDGGDDDGDGHKFPFPCVGPLLLVCACALGPEICLFCLGNPTGCFCAVFPKRCGGKPKPPKKKNRKACPVPPMRLPPEEVHIVNAYDTAFPHYSFDMEVNFKQESPDKTPYCDCNCGEYRQYISGFFRHPDYGGGPARLQEHRIAYGRLLDPSDPREDGDKKGNPYGHRYEDAARTSLRPNNDPNDRFLHDRETGCQYLGHDDPGLENSPQDHEIHVHLKFHAGPFDACNNEKVGEWKKWEVKIDRVPKRPPLVAREFKVRSGLPQSPKEGQDINLDIAIVGEEPGCHGRIPVTIIGVSDFVVNVFTKNSEPVQIAPDVCPDIWILPYQSIPVYR